MQFPQHGERTQLRETGQVDAVIPYYDVHEAVALVAREAVEAHCGEVHAHHNPHEGGLARPEIIGMQRRAVAETTRPEVERAARGIAVQIRVEAEKARKANKEHYVEVGKAILRAVEPQQAVGHVVEKRPSVLLAAQRVAQKLGHKHGYRQFAAVERQRRVGAGHAHLPDALQLARRPHLALHVELRQRLEILFLLL